MKWEAFSGAHAKYGGASSDSAKLLGDQLNECTSNLGSAQQTFEDYADAQGKRKEVFQNFRADVNVDVLDQFKNKLLHHLSSSIVVKENRNRYQKEQFDRLLVSAQARNLKNQNNTMEQFCVDYSRIIESMIDQSHNYKSPKIQANYDEFGESTVRPLNSTIFYYFFSADRTKRTIAQWLLSTVRYPNEKVRRAYMRFFAWNWEIFEIYLNDKYF